MKELPNRSGSNQNAGYLFKATGAVQNTRANNSYGGVVYSYSSQSLRVWYPPVNDTGKNYLVYLDNLFGKSSTATRAELEITTLVPYGKCYSYYNYIHEFTKTKTKLTRIQHLLCCIIIINVRYDALHSVTYLKQNNLYGLYLKGKNENLCSQNMYCNKLIFTCNKNLRPTVRMLLSDERTRVFVSK